VNNDLDFNALEKDAEELASIPKENKLKALSDLALEQYNMEVEISNIEDALKELKRQRDEISEKQIPEIMNELAIDSFRLKNGAKVALSPYYGAKIESREAYKWLEENGHEDIIKGEIDIPFPKGFDRSKLKAIMDVARGVGLGGECKEEVHPSTLRAWVKEMITTGQPFPRELFNAYTGYRTKISIK
jgi:hypothetical protein